MIRPQNETRNAVTVSFAFNAVHHLTADMYSKQTSSWQTIAAELLETTPAGRNK